MSLQPVITESTRRRNHAEDTRRSSSSTGIHTDPTSNEDSDEKQLGCAGETDTNANSLVEQSAPPAVFPHLNLTAEDIYGPRIVWYAKSR